MLYFQTATTYQIELPELFDLEIMNPYEIAISIIGKTLEAFDDDHLIPVYGFGMSTTCHSLFGECECCSPPEL